LPRGAGRRSTGPGRRALRDWPRPATSSPRSRPTEKDSPSVQFKILGRNYNSLDTAFGAEYTEEVGWANYYIHDLQPGCNTLEVTGGSNNVTLQLNP
jgi:hypothetical protein